MQDSIQVLIDSVFSDSSACKLVHTVAIDSTVKFGTYFKIINFDVARLFQILKDAAIVIGTLIAFLGLRTWKKQLKGKTEYELARRFLKRVYEFRDVLDFIRIPIQTSEESINAMKEHGYDYNRKDQNYHKKSIQAVYEVRWQKVNDAQSNLKIEVLEAEALWGDKKISVAEIIEPLYMVVNENC